MTGTLTRPDEGIRTAENSVNAAFAAGPSVEPTGNADVDSVGSRKPAGVETGDPIVIDILGNDAATKGGDLTLVAVSRPRNGSAEIAEDGKAIYTPDAGFNGGDSFEYTVTDGAGRLAIAQVDVSVRPRNSAPTLMVTDVYGRAGQSVALGIMAMFPTADDDPTADPGAECAVTITGLPGTAVLRAGEQEDAALVGGGEGCFVVHGASDKVAAMLGALRVVLPDNFDGTFLIDVIAQAGNGVAKATSQITVANPKSEPGDTNAGIRNNQVSVKADSALTFNIFGDGEAARGGLNLVSNTAAENGRITVEPDGTVRYVPDPTFTGVDSFEYTARDASGDTFTETATINVAAVEDIPATKRAKKIRRKKRKGDGAVTIPLFPRGDSDLAVTGVEGPQNGTVTIDNVAGTAYYTPNADFCGSDWFISTIYDKSCGESCSSLVAVNVSEMGAEATAEPTIQGEHQMSYGDGRPGDSHGKIFAYGPDDIGADVHAIGGFQAGPGGDVIDLSGLLDGVTPDRLRDVIRLDDDGFDTMVRIVSDTQSGFRDLAVVHGLTGRTLGDLIADGNLKFASATASH